MYYSTIALILQGLLIGHLLSNTELPAVHLLLYIVTNGVLVVAYDLFVRSE